MMLMLLVAGLAIGCSTGPKPNLSEKEAIGIARSAIRADGTAVSHASCWRSKSSLTNFAHTESATFKPSGIWVITVRNSWSEKGEVIKEYGTASGNISRMVGAEKSCTYAVDDSSGTFVSN